MPYNFKIRGLKDLVYEESNERALKIDAERDKYREGKSNNSSVKIGIWKGSISDIEWLTETSRKEVSPSERKQLDYPDLTPEQVERNKVFTKRLKEEYKAIREKSKFISG